MITSVFGKSKPINFILCSGILLIYLVIDLFTIDKSIGVDLLLDKAPAFILLVFLLFIVDFIVKKNDLSQKNDYALFITTISIGLFPSIFDHIEIVLICVLILLAVRRILSLRSLHSVKQKIFDSILFISLAFLVDSWILVFVIMVYVAILTYVSNDYKNWLVPFVGFFTVFILYATYQFYYDQNILTNWLFTIDFAGKYSIVNYAKIILHSSICFLFFINIVVFLLKSKNYSSQKKSSFLLIITMFFIGLFYVLFTNNLSDNQAILTLFPIAVLTANSLENIDNERLLNILLLILTIVSLIFNIYQKIN